MTYRRWVRFAGCVAATCVAVGCAVATPEADGEAPSLSAEGLGELYSVPGPGGAALVTPNAPAAEIVPMAWSYFKNTTSASATFKGGACILKRTAKNGGYVSTPCSTDENCHVYSGATRVEYRYCQALSSETGTKYCFGTVEPQSDYCVRAQVMGPLAPGAQAAVLVEPFDTYRDLTVYNMAVIAAGTNCTTATCGGCADSSADAVYGSKNQNPAHCKRALSAGTYIPRN